MSVNSSGNPNRKRGNKKTGKAVNIFDQFHELSFKNSKEYIQQFKPLVQPSDEVREKIIADRIQARTHKTALEEAAAANRKEGAAEKMTIAEKEKSDCGRPRSSSASSSKKMGMKSSKAKLIEIKEEKVPIEVFIFPPGVIVPVFILIYLLLSNL